MQVFLQPAQQVDNGALGQDVKRGRRLVQDQDLRVEQQGNGQQRALAHAAAQLMRVRVNHAVRVELDEAQKFEESFAHLAAVVPVMRLGRVPDLVPHFEDGIKRVQRRLKDHGAVAPTKLAQRSFVERRGRPARGRRGGK